MRQQELADGIVERFLRYTQVWTTSDKHGEKTPTTDGQWDLARMLEKELRELGINDVELSDHCYVIARLPANIKTAGLTQPETMGFLAHLDTSSEVSGKDVKPEFVKNYDGKKITLKNGITLDPDTDADLASQTGKAIIHTDGTTLLGADDKAGIAEIVSAAAFLLEHPEIEHGCIEIIFSPDEETGKGLPCFPLEKIKSKVCWTVDGGGGGELEIECFNAYGVTVQCTGKVIHPGTARGIMVNAALMASAFSMMLPRSESPEATDGYYGYYCLMECSGNQEHANLDIIVRDFTRTGMKRRIAALESFARAVEAQFPGGVVQIKAEPTYFNMKEKIDEHPEIIEKLKHAAANCGIDFRLKPIRGGTDGSRLTELGIPTPNIFTGGRNFHSLSEWCSVDEMVSACKLVIELIKLS